jgi:hypothetical protein
MFNIREFKKYRQFVLEAKRSTVNREKGVAVDI